MPATFDLASHHAIPSTRWICALHTDLLGRAPDPDDLVRWTDHAHQGATHRELAERFLRSPEYCRHQVEAQYRALLDGDSDPAAVGAWTQSLEAGAPLQNVVAGLCDSSEYRARNPTPTAFVASLYHRLLQRPPDAAGEAGWLRALADRASTLSVIQGFVRSTEYCARRLTELHVRLLGRELERPHLLRWVVAAAQGTALQHFALEIVTSAEYILRAAGGDPAPPADPDGPARPPTGAGPAIAGARSLLPRLVSRSAVVRYAPAGPVPAGPAPAGPVPAGPDRG